MDTTETMGNEQYSELVKFIFSFCCFHLAWPPPYSVMDLTDTPGTAINLELCHRNLLSCQLACWHISVSKIFIDPETVCSLLKYSDYMLLRHWSSAGMYILFALQGVFQILYQCTFGQGEVVQNDIPNGMLVFHVSKGN